MKARLSTLAALMLTATVAQAAAQSRGPSVADVHDAEAKARLSRLMADHNRLLVAQCKGAQQCAAARRQAAAARVTAAEATAHAAELRSHGVAAQRSPRRQKRR